MLPYQELFLWTLFISFLLALIYRIFTNPEKIRELKKDLNFYKEKMKKAQKQGDAKKTQEYTSDMMKISHKQLKMNMKPMMFSMIIVIALLGFIHTTFGSIEVNFDENNQATFSYGVSEYQVIYEEIPDSFNVGVDLNSDGMFSIKETFKDGDIFSDGKAYWQVSPAMEGFFLFSHEKEGSVLFTPMLVRTPFALPFLGSYLNWFWWYLIITMPATWIFRKALGVE